MFKRKGMNTMTLTYSECEKINDIENFEILENEENLEAEILQHQTKYFERMDKKLFIIQNMNSWLEIKFY